VKQVGTGFAPSQVTNLISPCGITLNDQNAIAVTGGIINAV